MFAEAGMHLGYNHPVLGPNSSGDWVTAVLEWEPGSNEVGDFTVSGIPNQPFAKASVGLQLKERFNGIELGPVDYWQHPRFDKVKRPRTPRVLLPYQGAPLCYLYATQEIALAVEISTVTVGANARGEATLVAIDGVEQLDSIGQPPDYLPQRTMRQARQGLIFLRGGTEGIDCWRLEGIKEWGHQRIYCRDRVKRFIEEAGYTNVKFLEVGEIIDE
jgi:hypothetical protein